MQPRVIAHRVNCRIIVLSMIATLCSAAVCLLAPALPGAPVDGAARNPVANRFDRAAFDGIEIEYQVHGAGEPVVFVHAGVFADWFEPLIHQPALADRYRVVSYHRVGYAGSSDVAGPVSIAQQAVHLRSLMHRLGIERAHVVGHSSGGLIALQLALDAPGMVQSLSLLEPALQVAPNRTQPQVPARSDVASAIELYRAGDKAGAVDTFMRAVAGPDYRATIDQMLPQAFAQALVDADTFFSQELPAVRQWSFLEADAKRVRQPVLLVMGARSSEVSPIWQQRQNQLNAWLPHSESFVLAGATHLLHVQNPRAMAERLVAFFAQHSLARSEVTDK
jgi:pimeloyl-ACP methyl ester carboxylesterase